MLKWVKAPKEIKEKIARAKVRFDIEFNEKGEITSVHRSCKIARPSCEGCKFKKTCESIEKRILGK